jgi:hypothetical protein
MTQCRRVASILFPRERPLKEPSKPKSRLTPPSEMTQINAAPALNVYNKSVKGFSLVDL